MSFPDKPVAQLLGAHGPVHAVTYSAGAGSYILTGSADRMVRLYNPQPTTGKERDNFVTKTTTSSSPAIPQGRLVQTYAEHGYEVLSLACASDNSRFVSAGGDRNVFLWDVSTAQTLRRFGGQGGGGGGGGPGGHAGRVNCVCFGGENDSLVISGGFDTTVRLWDVRSNNSSRPIQVLSDARDAVAAVVVRGSDVVAGSVDGRVRTYDVRQGRLTTDVISGTAGVTSLGLTRDGRSLLVGSLDSAVRLMDRSQGTCLRTYGGSFEGSKGSKGSQTWQNKELRVQSILGGHERFVVAGDEAAEADSTDTSSNMPSGKVWAWDLLTGRVVAVLSVPWGPHGTTSNSRAVGRDGREKARRNVTSCLAWQDGGWGSQFCVGSTSGAVTVFG